MRFTPTPIAGAWVIDHERIEDERGFFARSWCEREFRDHGLDPGLAQCNISFNARRGTLRGLHYQVAPHEEAKLIRCTMGAIFDVAVDLSTGKWFAVELTAENRRMLYIAAGLAHGFQSLTDETEVFYQMSDFHHPASARTVRWNDPDLAIDWPLSHPVVSDKDSQAPLWRN